MITEVCLQGHMSCSAHILARVVAKGTVGRRYRTTSYSNSKKVGVSPLWKTFM